MPKLSKKRSHVGQLINARNELKKQRLLKKEGELETNKQSAKIEDIVDRLKRSVNELKAKVFSLLGFYKIDLDQGTYERTSYATPRQEILS